MSAQQLVLTVTSERPLRPLIEEAIRRELALLEQSIQRTQQQLQSFESRYGFSTSEFLSRLTQGQLSENLDTIDWLGEYRLLERLNANMATLRETRLAD